MEKLKWMWTFFRTNTYVLLTDRGGVVNLQIADPDSLENALLLEAQRTSLRMFQDELGNLIKEHDDAIRLLSHRRRAQVTHLPAQDDGVKVRRP